MKRRVLTIITVFLLLGAIVNVAVVWGCAYVAYRVADAHEDVLNRMQIASVMDRWLGHHDYATEAYGGTLNAWSTSNTDIVYSEGYTLGWVSGGWPLQSFEGGLVFDGGGSRTWGLIICGWLCLPYLPTWPGFPINTLFYAAILWGLFAAPFALRRRRRIKRGLCPKCAYPIGESAVCTECGHHLPLPSGEGRRSGDHGDATQPVRPPRQSRGLAGTSSCPRMGAGHPESGPIIVRWIPLFAGMTGGPRQIRTKRARKREPWPKGGETHASLPAPNPPTRPDDSFCCVSRAVRYKARAQN